MSTTTGKQARLRRALIVERVLLSNECSLHTPPALVAKLKEYTGQAITQSQMVGLEPMTASFVMDGSIGEVRKACGKGYSQLIDVVVTDSGLIGDSGAQYTHTYAYATKVKSITPDTGDSGKEACTVELYVHAYSFSSDGELIDEVDSRTGKIMIGGHVIIEAGS